ncbi:MAG: hypothetical protein JNJ57_19860 [Saprospiraceae bacterium]|nr:hypothetical protein [Saprospiraceae bacterium]
MQTSLMRHWRPLLYCLLFTLVSFQTKAQKSAELSSAQMAALEQLMEPHRKKVTDILEADKSGQYERYLADLEAISNEKNPKVVRELIVSLKRNHYSFIKAAYQKAVINHEDLRSKVAKIINNNRFTLDEFGGILIDVVSPAASLPIRFEATFTCPLSVQEEEGGGGGVTLCDASVNNCVAYATSMGEIAGGCRSKAGIGEHFTLSQGNFTKMTISARFDLNLYGFALAVGGYSQSNSKVGVRIKGPNLDQTVILLDRVVVAPIVFISSFETKTANFQAIHQFNGSFAGNQDFTALAYFETFSIGGGAGGSFADSKGDQFDFIKVTAE